MSGELSDQGFSFRKSQDVPLKETTSPYEAGLRGGGELVERLRCTD